MAVPIHDDNPTRRRPWVNHALIVANIVVFLFLQPAVFQGGELDTEDGDELSAADLADAEEYVYEYGVIPCEVTELEPLAEEPPDCDAGDERPSRLPADKSVLLSLLAHMFVHGGLLHLAGNMFYLWIFGNNVEDRIGHVGYLVFYLATGVAAMLGHVYANLGDTVPAVGASGAVSGVMGAYLVFHPRARLLTLVPGLVFQIVYIPAFVLLGLYFVLQFFTPDIAQVAWVAHVAGMVAGAVIALAIRVVGRDRGQGAPIEEPSWTSS